LNTPAGDGDLDNMAHIHLEDGSFTLFWVLVWWAVALAIIALALIFFRTQRKPDNRRITIAAFCTAAAFVLFQVDIPIAGGVHISLTPLIGILTGPVIGLFIVFIINILSAAVGHGGWGMIGANTLVNLSEVLFAYGIWRGLKPFIKNIFFRASAATLCGLILGNFVMIGIIVLSGIQGVNQSPEQILTGLFLIAAVNTAVAVIEAVMTGLVVSYIGKMRPDLLDTE
jgi:cobalt/nickel transport system permease protein